MTETASLQIKVESSGTARATDALDRLERSAQRSERATDKFVESAQQAGRQATASFKQVEVQAKRTERATDQMSSIIGGAGGVLVGAAAAAMALSEAVDQIAGAAERAKNLVRLSDLAGMTEQQFSAAAYGAESYGVSMEKLADISKDTIDKLGDYLATGGGEFASFFDNVAPKVGITAESLKGLSGAEVLGAVKSAMDAANISAEEQVYYLEAIANDASRLSPLLANNNEEWRKQEQRFNALNVVTATQATELAEMHDKFRDLGVATKGFTDRLVHSLTPAINFATDALIEMFRAPNAEELRQEIRSIEADIKRFQGLADKGHGKDDGYGSLLRVESLKKELAELQEQLEQIEARPKRKPVSVTTDTSGDAVGSGGLLDSGRRATDQWLEMIGQRNMAELELLDRKERLEIEKLNQYHKEKMISEDQFHASKSAIRQYYAVEQARVIDRQKSDDDAASRKLEVEKQASAAWLDVIAQRHMTELELLDQKMQQEFQTLQEYRDKGLISAEQYYDGQIAIEGHYTSERKRLAQQRADDNQKALSQVMTGSADLFGSMADITQTFAGEQSAVYKAMFAASKAFAIADAAIQIQSGIAKAAANPWPTNLAAMASVAAATSGIVSNIASISYGGARASGGQVVGGQSYLVGEHGPEVVTMGGGGFGHVTPAHQVNNSRPVNVTINNQAGNTEATAQQQPNGDVVVMIREIVRSTWAADIASGQGMARQGETAYGWGRRL